MGRSHCLLATAPDRTVSGPWRTPVTSTLTASTVLRGLSPARTILFLMLLLGSVNTLTVPTEKVALPSNCTEFNAPTPLVSSGSERTDCRAFFTCSVHTNYHPRLAG